MAGGLGVAVGQAEGAVGRLTEPPSAPDGSAPSSTRYTSRGLGYSKGRQIRGRRLFRTVGWHPLRGAKWVPSRLEMPAEGQR